MQKSDPRESKLWATYFFLLFALCVLEILFGRKDPASLVNDVLTGLCLVGLWGYISQKPIGSQTAWIVMFFLQIAGLIFTWVVSTAARVPIAISLGATILVVPLLYALYRYGFRSAGLWALNKS